MTGLSVTGCKREERKAERKGIRMQTVNREHKDRLFRFLFGNKEKKGCDQIISDRK